MVVKVEVSRELLIKEICQRSVRPEKGGGEPVHMLQAPRKWKSIYRCFSLGENPYQQTQPLTKSYRAIHASPSSPLSVTPESLRRK